MVLSLWTDDPRLAQMADIAGIDRIGLDLEHIGKVERQGHFGNTRLSLHQLEQLPAIKSALSHAKLFVRTNPLHEKIKEEIEYLIANDTEVLMLPMFTHEREVEHYCELVAGRAEVVPLIETPGALRRRNEIINIPEIHEVFVGLNDLSISLGLQNHFQVISLPEFEDLSIKTRERGIRFGFGGLGRAEDSTLPIPSDLIYALQPLFGCSSALLSRVFFQEDMANGQNLITEINALRARLDFWSMQTRKQQRDALTELNLLAGKWER